MSSSRELSASGNVYLNVNDASKPGTPSLNIDARAREIAAGLTPSWRCALQSAVSWNSVIGERESDLRMLARRGLLTPSETGYTYYVTDLGRAVARVLAEGGSR